MLLVAVGGIPGKGGVGTKVGCLRWLGGGAPVPLHLQYVRRVWVVPFGQGRHLAEWF